MPLPTQKTKPKYDPGLLTILIYGPAGIGKSTFCSRAEEVLFIPTEPGLNAIEAYQYPLIESWPQLLQAYEEIKAGGHQFKTLAIDTLNNAFKLCVEYICKKNNVQHETDIPGNSKGYALVNNEFYRVMKLFAGLPYGLYLTAHQREVTIKLRTGELTKIVPDLPDKSRNHMVALSDFVLRCDTEEVETEGGKRLRRIIHSRPVLGHEAKDRFGVIPDPMPLSYPDFIKEFQEGMARKEAKRQAKAAAQATETKTASATQEQASPSKDTEAKSAAPTDATSKKENRQPTKAVTQK